MLLECHHILPDQIGRQNPWVLFRMLDDMQDGSDTAYSNEHLRIFYGEEV